MSFEIHSYGARRLFALFVSVVALPFMAGTVLAQDDEGIEEIVVTGTQIRGAKISDALAVSVISSQEIGELGIDSGDELIQFMAEQGSNFFSEAENISGGVNAARGDVGAYNLRNLGTGNTLVLVNGRRMVNAASYQTELSGGSFIPVNTVNSQSLPVAGLERLEVLRDGASAIYGADAVAGVVNYVLKTDFEGFNIRAKYASYEGLPRTDQTLTLEWGKNFNGGRTNFSLFANYYHRDRVNSQDDAKWADDDYRRYLSDDSPWADTTAFRNSSANSEYGQFDIRTPLPSTHSLRVAGIVDNAGEFNMYPIGSDKCGWALNDNQNVCGAADGQLIERYNNNTNRDLFSDLDRVNVFAYLNHDFGNGLESFTEMSAYLSYTNTYRQASTRLSAVAKYRVGGSDPYNPFGPCTLADGSVNPYRLDDAAAMADVPCEGYELEIDNYRWTAVPRVVDNDGDVFRFLQGFRGEMGSWDWESAVTWSRATKEDITHNRVSNTIMDTALADSTLEAYNPFNGGIDTNIEQALIDVRRDNETELAMIDFKISKGDLFELPAGPVGILIGLEYREESFIDDRDPRLDNTINYTDNAGNSFPIVSDVMNSSPSLDSKGSREVTSAFTEFQVPVFNSLDLQLALRYEDFSDIGSSTVGKVGFGWRPGEKLLFRGSWSQAFRAPNLVTVNESGVARSNTNDDYLCFYVDPTELEFDCRYGMQRTAGGSDLLVSEQSTNYSLGLVFDLNEHLTFTLDYWSIEKEDTIGLFGEENHTAYDLLLRIEEGNSNCASVDGNIAVVREDALGLTPEQLALFDAAGLCPAGEAQQVNDVYKNLDTRKIEGHDVGIYYTHDTSIGTFNVTYNGAFLDFYEQQASGPVQELLDAQDDGTLPASIDISGFSNLVRQNGNPKEKQTLRVNWRMNDWGASVSGTQVSDFVQTSLTLDDGTRYIVPSMTRYNASVDYRFDTFGDSDMRLRFGVVNALNERAPLTDSRFGYFSDMHTDLPRAYYLDLKMYF